MQYFHTIQGKNASQIITTTIVPTFWGLPYENELLDEPDISGKLLRFVTAYPYAAPLSYDSQDPILYIVGLTIGVPLQSDVVYTLATNTPEFAPDPAP